ncbi:MAG TPA: hypothetical protein VHV55_01875 [Pirellulales bacterium]|nr:hypothetical protein [Pirellulales bacterium]
MEAEAGRQRLVACNPMVVRKFTCQSFFLPLNAPDRLAAEFRRKQVQAFNVNQVPALRVFLVVAGIAQGASAASDRVAVRASAAIPATVLVVAP